MTSQKLPSVVLLHGFRGSPLGLEAIAQDLQKAGYPVYVPAVPPFAGARDLTEYSPEKYAEYFAQYIIEHELDHPILVGHSMGSIIASAIASLKPELVNHKIVLLSPISRKTSKAISAVSPLAGIVPTKVSDYVTTQYLFVPRHNKALFRESLQITHACSNDCPPSKKMLSQVTKFTTNYAVPDFPLEGKKVLIIAGGKDLLVKKSDTKKLAKGLKAQLVFLPESGHLHNYEKPHETAAAIIDFIKR